MRLPKFEYFEPKDLGEAISILQNEPGAKMLAGGTDLLVNMKHRVDCPPTVVNIKGIDGLDFIKQDNGAIRIGALTKLKNLYMTQVIIEKLPGLARAAEAVGSYHHQVMGTLVGNICQQNRCKYFNQSQWWRSSRPTCYKAGGEICHVVNKKETCYASYCGDIAPVLLVLNARILLMGSQGRKELAIEDLFSGDGKAPLNLSPGDIVTEVVIPATDKNGVSGYSKFANRDSIDFPILGSAFWATPDDTKYRVAFTAVDRKPVRALQVEAFLDGKELSAKNITEAGELAATAAKPVKNSVYSPTYKRRMMGLLLKEVVSQAMGRNSA